MSHRNKIAFFGTSHTYGDCAEGISHYDGQKKFVKTPWPELFAKQLNKEFYNFGIGGSDNMTMLDAILEAFSRGTMDEVDTLILEPRLSYDAIRLPYDYIGYKPKANSEYGPNEYTTHWLDTGRHTQEHNWPDTFPRTEELWVRFALMDLKDEAQFRRRMNADYLGNIHDRDLEDKDIKKFVELSKLYVSNSHYLDYLNFQFIKNVYTICKGYGIKFYWLNFESNRFQKFFTDEREVYWENEQQLLDLCINPKQIVRNYIKEAKLAQDPECSCGHFNDYAQPYISAYLIKGYNERKNS